MRLIKFALTISIVMTLGVLFRINSEAVMQPVYICATFSDGYVPSVGEGFFYFRDRRGGYPPLITNGGEGTNDRFIENGKEEVPSGNVVNINNYSSANCSKFTPWQALNNNQRAWLRDNTVNVPSIGNKPRQDQPNNASAWGCSESPLYFSLFIPNYNCSTATLTLTSNDTPIGTQYINCTPNITVSPTPSLTPTPVPSPTPSLTPTPIPTPTPLPRDPWLITTKGDTYSDEYILELADVIENTSLAENGLLPHISTYLLLQNDDGLLAKASFNNFDRVDYTDLNSTPRVAGASNWFQYLKNKVLNNTDHIQEYTSSVNISGNVNQYFSPVANPDNDDTYTIYMRNGGTIQNLTCNLKTIFIVEGNVVINPELVIDQAKDGCVFIVDGQTTINPGGDKGSNDATPITNYDVIEAFIITNMFESVLDTNEDGLLIEGGLIVTGSNDPVFGRDLGNVRNYQAPSEVFRYDGTRYMYLFGEMFTYKKNYNIREKAFINSLD